MTIAQLADIICAKSGNDCVCGRSKLHSIRREKYKCTEIYCPNLQCSFFCLHLR